MSNRFKNGYTCKMCNDENELGKRFLISNPLTPVYFRVDRKFKFAGLVKCSKHGDHNGFAAAIALRDL